jgi:hypothetical protein
VELKDVDEIITTYKEKKANEYLKEGYTLLAVAGGNDEENTPQIIYSFGKKKKSTGWTKENLG